MSIQLVWTLLVENGISSQKVSIVQFQLVSDSKCHTPSISQSVVISCCCFILDGSGDTLWCLGHDNRSLRAPANAWRIVRFELLCSSTHYITKQAVNALLISMVSFELRSSNGRNLDSDWCIDQSIIIPYPHRDDGPCLVKLYTYLFYDF